MNGLYASKTIHVGDHVNVQIFGLTFSLDALIATLIAATITSVLMIVIAKKASATNPGKLQIGFEFIVEQIQELTSSALGPEGPRFLPLGVMFFTFILICNWFEAIPTALRPGISGSILPTPTADVNLPAAMAVIVFVGIHYLGVKHRGRKGYFRHYAQPYKALIPINVIEEITKPITMTFRLFGNMFAGGLMLVVLAVLMPYFIYPFLALPWKIFDLAIGAIQAFIFALLTIMYFGMAMSTDEH